MATTTNFSWETPDDTDLVKDGAAAIRTLGNSIDTSFVDLKGGTTGQVLSKASGTDLDFTWVAQDDSNAIQNAIVDAKGDLITATAADTPARLGVGTNGQVLTADSSTATGLVWATPATGSSGLTLISVQTFSASSGINIDNVFTSTYTNYRLVFSNITTSTSIYVSYRERAGGTTNATNYKKGQYYRSYTSGTAGINSGGTEGNMFDWDTDTTNTLGAILELQCPATTAYTGYQWMASESYQWHTGGGIHANATAYDGFALFPYSGTMSGTVSIYGYQKAV